MQLRNNGKWNANRKKWREKEGPGIHQHKFATVFQIRFNFKHISLCSKHQCFNCSRIFLHYPSIFFFCHFYSQSYMNLHSQLCIWQTLSSNFILNTLYQFMLSLGIKPMTLMLLASCSTVWATGMQIIYKYQKLEGKVGTEFQQMKVQPQTHKFFFKSRHQCINCNSIILL